MANLVQPRQPWVSRNAASIELRVRAILPEPLVESALRLVEEFPDKNQKPNPRNTLDFMERMIGQGVQSEALIETLNKVYASEDSTSSFRDARRMLGMARAVTPIVQRSHTVGWWGP